MMTTRISTAQNAFNELYVAILRDVHNELVKVDLASDDVRASLARVAEAKTNRSHVFEPIPVAEPTPVAEPKPVVEEPTVVYLEVGDEVDF